MNTIGIVQNILPYLAKRGEAPDSVVRIGRNNINELAAGSVAIVLANGNLYDLAATAGTTTDIGDQDYFTVHIGLSSTAAETNRVKVIGPIYRRNVIDFDYQVATANLPVPESIMVSFDNFVSPEVVASTGDITLVVKNLTFNNVINNGRISATVTKLAGETSTQLVTKLVAALNQNIAAIPAYAGKQDFVTFTDGNGEIEFIAKNNDVKLAIHVDSYGPTLILTKSNQVNRLTTAADIIAMERDFQATQGNGGYVELNDLWYNSPIEAKLDKQYGVITITEQATHTLPQNTVNSAIKRSVIAVADIAYLLNFVQSFTNLIGTAFEYGSTGFGAEPADPDGNPINQNPAN